MIPTSDHSSEAKMLRVASTSLSSEWKLVESTAASSHHRLLLARTKVVKRNTSPALLIDHDDHDDNSEGKKRLSSGIHRSVSLPSSSLDCSHDQSIDSPPTLPRRRDSFILELQDDLLLVPPQIQIAKSTSVNLDSRAISQRCPPRIPRRQDSLVSTRMTKKNQDGGTTGEERIVMEMLDSSDMNILPSFRDTRRPPGFPFRRTSLDSLFDESTDGELYF